MYTQVLVSCGPEVSVTLAAFLRLFCFFIHTIYVCYIYIYYLTSCWKPSILADTCLQAYYSVRSVPSPRIRCEIGAHELLAQLDCVAPQLLYLVLSIYSPTGFLHFPLPMVYRSSLEAQKTNSPNLQKWSLNSAKSLS